MRFVFIIPVFYYLLNSGFAFFIFNNNLDKNQIPTDTVRQHITPNTVPDNNSALVKIVVKDDNENNLSGIDVLLYSISEKLYFIATTDANGEARFLVPAAKKYFVAIEEMNNMGDIDLPKIGGIVFKKLFYYVPTKVTEKTRGDTIFQEIGDYAKPSSARALVKVLVTDLQKKPLPNEEVMLKVENKNIFYKTFTDNKGIAYLLIPKGQKYNVSFKYDRDVDLLDVKLNTAFKTFEIEYEYIGSKKVEEYYANASRNNQGFITEFKPNKLKKIKKPEDVKKIKKSWGYVMKFPDSSKISTPAVYLDQILVNGGYYDQNFYSFDRLSGNFRWGVELFEAGTSPVVCEDSVIVLNTESCTLYALDAISGDLLWSCWLAPALISTPAVADGKIITCYPATPDGAASSVVKDKTYALVCFNLKTGKILWQKWLDAEILGSPVVFANRVYCTTLSGKVFGFNLNNGENAVSAALQATAPPVVDNAKLYIPHKKTAQSAIEILGLYHKDKLTLIRDFTLLSRKHIAHKNPYDAMHYTGMQPLLLKDKIYMATDNQIVCFNAQTGEKLWQNNVTIKHYDSNYAATTQPILAGTNIITATQNGNIKIFDALSGKVINEFAVGLPIVTEPVVYEGWIYAGALDGCLVALNTNNKALTGWTMWRGNGKHNPFVNQ